VLSPLFYYYKCGRGQVKIIIHFQSVQVGGAGMRVSDLDGIKIVQIKKADHALEGVDVIEKESRRITGRRCVNESIRCAGLSRYFV